MPALISVIVELDSNINKVEFYLVNDFAGNPTATIENSGDYFNIVPNTTLYGKVYMEDNYVINTVSSNPDEEINNLTTDTFNILATSNEQTITITSKSTVTYQIEQGTYYWIAQTLIDNFKDMRLGNNALNFKSNNEDFVSMNFDDETGAITYVKSDGTSVIVLGQDNTFNENYRQIIIETAQEVSEEFYQMMIENGLWETTQVNIVSIDLTTLSGWSSVADGSHTLKVVSKADGYKDSEKSEPVNFVKTSTTAHTLTWGSSISVKVNGSSVTSPYTLANGDTIKITRPSGYQSVLITTNDSSYDTDVVSSPLTLSNTDITLSDGSVDMSPSMGRGFTINYSETSNGSSGGAIN